MDRTLKFRAWDKHFFGMCPVANIRFNDTGAIIVETNPEGDECSHFEHGVGGFLMQFTGLHDKHGREIYEGDIVTSTHPAITPGYKWLVQWKEVGFEPFVYEERDHGELAFGIKEHLETFEVIGNIYEHPELTPK